MSSNATSAPEPGQTLAGKYLVEEVLGIGGMGVVVAAKHLQLDQRVAIKYLLPQALLNPEVVERFAREARAAAKIRGEHVARVIDVGQFDDGAPYMVMEHLDGHDLAKHLELHGPLPIEDACRFLLETCEALAEAHAAKIVHRDLKPSNMFLATQPDKSAIIKVLDFGISKTGDAPSASLTKTSALMGTAFYMSPEQLTNPKGVDHRSDIWSLGVILYELLAGRQPFIGETVPEIIGGILQNQPDALKTLRADVPAGIEALIAKCMQTKPADRYQSVAQLAKAIGPFAHLRDRLSIDIASRVLGEKLETDPPPPVVRSSTVMMPPSAQLQTGPAFAPADPPPQTQQPQYVSPSRPPPSMPMNVGAATPVAGAVTTHGLSTSAITEKPKRSKLMLIAAPAAIALAIVGTLVATKVANTGADKPATAATGLVAPPSEPTGLPAAVQTAAAGGGTTTLLPATGASPANPAQPTTPAPSTGAANVPPANVARPNVPAAPVRPSTPVAAAPVKSGTVASATPPVAANPPTPNTAAPTAAPPPVTSKNPLNMGIK